MTILIDNETSQASKKREDSENNEIIIEEMERTNLLSVFSFSPLIRIPGQGMNQSATGPFYASQNFKHVIILNPKQGIILRQKTNARGLIDVFAVSNVSAGDRTDFLSMKCHGKSRMKVNEIRDTG